MSDSLAVNIIHCGDAVNVLRTLPDDSIQCCITSPPYWGLRDYGVEGQLGLEKTLGEYVAKMVEVFGEVRRVLRSDGTLWLNLGSSYAGGGNNRGNHSPLSDKQASNAGATGQCSEHVKNVDLAAIGYKVKDMIPIPWIVAMALRTDGWWLRQDIIWSKPNPMPESVTDRCTKAHEYVFLMTKSANYYYDAEAIKEPATCAGRILDYTGDQKNNSVDPIMQATRPRGRMIEVGTTRNRRSVWTVPTFPFSGAHFATFPPDLIKPMVLAGSPPKCCGVCGTAWKREVEHVVGYSKECPKTVEAHHARGGTGVPVGTIGKSGSGRTNGSSKTLGWRPVCSHNDDTGRSIVLDPFMGAGTVALVAKELNRQYIGIELNPDYIQMAERRLRQEVLPLDGADAREE